MYIYTTYLYLCILSLICGLVFVLTRFCSLQISPSLASFILFSLPELPFRSQAFLFLFLHCLSSSLHRTFSSFNTSLLLFLLPSSLPPSLLFFSSSSSSPCLPSILVLLSFSSFHVGLSLLVFLYFFFVFLLYCLTLLLLPFYLVLLSFYFLSIGSYSPFSSFLSDITLLFLPFYQVLLSFFVLSFWSYSPFSSFLSGLLLPFIPFFLV